MHSPGLVCPGSCPRVRPRDCPSRRVLTPRKDRVTCASAPCSLPPEYRRRRCSSPHAGAAVPVVPGASSASSKREGLRRRHPSRHRLVQRWEADDRPLLEAAFKAAGVESDIQNAQGRQDQVPVDRRPDDQRGRQRPADRQPGQRAPAQRSRRRPAAQGITTIDYDRLTLGGGASYYVSFDNVAVGTADRRRASSSACRPPATRPAPSSSSTARRPTTTPRCSSRATTRSSEAPATPSSPTRPCPTGTTPRPARSSSRSTAAHKNIVGVASANDGLGGAVSRGARQERSGRQGPGHRPGRHGRGSAARAAGHPVRDGLQGHQEGGRRGCKLAIDLAKGDKAAADALATGDGHRHHDQARRSSPSCCHRSRSSRRRSRR